VDIDPGAIDIAKLRLWLSLIVDEDDYHNIKPLPNLDYKIMQGNSLIEEFHGISLNIEKENKNEKPFNMQLFNDNKDLDKLIKDLHNKQNELFLATHPEEKKLLKRKVEDAVVEIFHYELQRNQVDYFRYFKRIEDIAKEIPKEKDKKEYYDKEKAKLDKRYKFDFAAVENELREMTSGNRVRNFFPWKLYFADVFRQNGGFDVVIANPPYVSHDKIENKSYLKNRYGCYEPFADLYCYFIELATNLQNHSGILCYITSNSYLKAEYGFPLRKLLLNQNSLLQIINVEDYQVFDSAIVNSAVFISQNKVRGFYPECIIVNSIYDGNKPFASFVDENKHFYSQNEFDVRSWSLANRNTLLLKQKMETVGPTLEELGTQIRLGIATGANYALIINEETKAKLVSRSKHNEDIIKPILRGRDIFRYYYMEPSLYVLLTKNGIDVKSEYPNVYDYLNTFGKKFKTRGAQGNHWANLRACSFFDDFQNEKIIWIELTDKGRFALCNDEIYLLNTAYFLLPPPQISARYLLGILNSKLIQFYLSIIAGTSGMGTLRWINVYAKRFPIPQKQINDQQPLITLTDQILSLKKSNPQADTSALEAEIDRMVYKLYDLTEAEIAIVEESSRK